MLQLFLDPMQLGLVRGMGQSGQRNGVQSMGYGILLGLADMYAELLQPEHNIPAEL
jgi:hypothetical protein